MRVLLAVDGSRASEHAARHVLWLRSSGMQVEAVLLNVQPPWAPPRSAEERRDGERLHAEAAEQAMGPASSVLTAGGVPFETTTHVGPVAESIVLVAALRRCRAIVMGTRGLGAVASLVLGSVATKVVQLAAVPVTLVK